MADQSPGFYFNVEEWRGSRSVGRMSMAERGVYLEMMIEQWLRRTLPDSADEVAAEIAITPEQNVEVHLAWPTVRRKFITDTSGRILNVKVEQVRRKQRAYDKKRRESGRAGGKASAAKRKTVGQLDVNDRSTTVQRPFNDRQPIREERKGVDQIGEDRRGTEIAGTARRPVTARSKRPIFTGQRLTVFEWMLDDLMRMLGSHADAFELDTWFWDADAAAMKETVVVSDWWPWLKAATQAEAQRRGLPIALATPAAGKQTTRLAAALANIKAEAS